MTRNRIKVTRRALVIALIAVLVISGIVGAATYYYINQNIPAEIDIVNPPTPLPPDGYVEVVMYSDSARTIPLTTIEFPSVLTTGGTSTITVYAPNEVTASTIIITNDIINSYAMSTPIRDDVTGAITLTITIPSGQTAGNNISIGNVGFATPTQP